MACPALHSRQGCSAPRRVSQSHRVAALSQRVDVCQSGSPQTVAPSIAYWRLPSSPGKKLSEVAADDQHEEVTFAWVRHGKKNSLIFLPLLPPANIV